MNRVWIILTLAVTGVVANAAEDPGELTFCTFGPKIKIVEPKFKTSAGCNGTAKIQGVLWECTPSLRAEAQIVDFRQKMLRLATKECSEFCRARGEGCLGRFEAPAKCGHETNREEASSLGKSFGCRKDCGGSSFVYCAIYHANFRTEDPREIADLPPNCRCIPSS